MVCHSLTHSLTKITRSLDTSHFSPFVVFGTLLLFQQYSFLKRNDAYLWSSLTFALGFCFSDTDTSLESLPYSIRVLLESAIRNCDEFEVTKADVENVLDWEKNVGKLEIPFKPARVLLQDFTYEFINGYIDGDDDYFIYH